MSAANKVLEGLTALETKFIDAAPIILAASSKKKVRSVLNDLKFQLATNLERLPSSQSSYAPMRKSLDSLGRVVLGALEAIELNHDTSRREVQSAGRKLRDDFIPAFRRALDTLTTKLKEQLERLDEQGLLSYPDAIVSELVKTYADVTKLGRVLKVHLGRNDPDEGSQLRVQLELRQDLVSATYGQIPESKAFDESAGILAQLSGNIESLLQYAKKQSLVSEKGYAKFTQNVARLERAISEVKRDVMHGHASLGKKARPSIQSLLKRKMDDVEKPGQKPMALVRSPNAHVKERLAEIQKARADLPKRLSGPFALIRAPVVPIFDVHDSKAAARATGLGQVQRNFSKNALLDTYGIKYFKLAEDLDDYVVLESQTLLAIDRRSAEKAMAELMPKRRAALKDADYMKYAQYLLDRVINPRGSQKYDLVSKDAVPNPNEAYMLMFWIMPSRVLNPLIQRGWNKLLRWSFPFDV